MTIAFEKYHGTGNDFIMIDNRLGTLSLSMYEVQQLCDRHFGIGSDGLILIEAPRNTGEDFYMNFYNPDGSSSFCGNGSRCAVMFAKNLGIERATFRFSAIDGPHEAQIEGDMVAVKMRDVVAVEQKSHETYFLHTGSPHAVVYVDNNLDTLDLASRALPIRHHQDYAPGGTNVNFVEALRSDAIRMRTFERGVEAETLSCGTGVTAAALVHGSINEKQQIEINTRGGVLHVRFEKKGASSFQNIFLIGPAQTVYSGHIHLK